MSILQHSLFLGMLKVDFVIAIYIFPVALLRLFQVFVGYLHSLFGEA